MDNTEIDKIINDALWKGEPCDNPDKGWINDSRGNRITRLGRRGSYGKLIAIHNKELEILRHKLKGKTQ